MIYHTKSKTMIITPTRCGSVTLHKILGNNSDFVIATTVECGENTIHGTQNSIDHTHFNIDRYVLLIRNPVDRIKSIFHHYSYINTKQFLNDFDQYDRRFKQCTSYLQKIDDTIKTENMRLDVDRIFNIDFEQLDVIYDNYSEHMHSVDINIFKSLSRTLYHKDILVGGYDIA